VSVELLPLPATEPSPPIALAQTLHGLIPSQASTSQACASAWR
jgi:hypothetical protein